MQNPNSDSLNHQHATFPGFPATLERVSWQFPSIINGYAHTLTGAEFKVLWYVLRHTYGWQKSFDKLSISQICNGIKRKKDGTYLDKGTGLSRKWAWKSVTQLEEKGFIVIKRQRGEVNEIYPYITTDHSDKYYSSIVENTTPAVVVNTPTINNIPINIANNITTLNNNNQGNKFSSIKEITQIEFQLIAKEYQVPLSFVVSKFDDLQNFCLSKDRVYKNYLAALRNFVKQDSIKIRKEAAEHVSKRGIDARHIK